MRKIASLTAVLATFALPAFAGFEATDEKLFVDYPDLLQEYDITGGEFVVHAILVRTNKVIYVITRDYRGRTLAFGSFECGIKFEYLDSFTDGFRDILCVSQDALNHQTKSVLAVRHHAGYEQQ